MRSVLGHNRLEARLQSLCGDGGFLPLRVAMTSISQDGEHASAIVMSQDSDPFKWSQANRK